ncbi:DUF6371 domain-containing protein [Cyclobacterium sp. 1_MG-2023]|uniref:DUF6371 domain-containing protein n=1 Tax=Cyclobacterium sp. 1_MG-2023 TaxID=3062681 RepID=UPI0026E493ED|nr:DUF6371 domain-containing protein [Cyclobacterium sp. 1_MG-2023]MDO6437131.1 DUF6371 domain-containing protein [Cyclobacterium sp. 1_MG-2023]
MGKNKYLGDSPSKFISTPNAKPISYFDPELMNATLKGYKKNNFFSFLKSIFGEASTMEAVKHYKIGTSLARNGANVFWYIDEHQKVRGGKIMLYNPSTGKRLNFFSWAHSRLKQKEYNLKLCFYGSHLLETYPTKDVGIVESEKTAIIASLVFPKLVWLASGGKSGLNKYKFQNLRNRNVFLFPDLSKPGDNETCFNLWTNEVNKIQDEIPCKFKVSDYFESRAKIEEKEMGLDLADYIILKDWKPKNERNEQNEGIQKPFIRDEKITNINNEQFDNIRKQIKKVIQGIREENKKESSLKDKIRDCEIPSGAILENKELLKRYRAKYGY